MKLGTNIQHVSGHYWKGLLGQRSKVKVIARPNRLFGRVRAVRACGGYTQMDDVASWDFAVVVITWQTYATETSLYIAGCDAVTLYNWIVLYTVLHEGE